MKSHLNLLGFAVLTAFVFPGSIVVLAAQEVQPDDTQVVSTVVQRNDGFVTLQGVLDPIETLRLATRDPGIVSNVLVSKGSVVKSGDRIAVLDSEMFAAEERRQLDNAAVNNKHGGRW